MTGEPSAGCLDGEGGAGQKYCQIAAKIKHTFSSLGVGFSESLPPPHDDSFLDPAIASLCFVPSTTNSASCLQITRCLVLSVRRSSMS